VREQEVLLEQPFILFFEVFHRAVVSDEFAKRAGLDAKLSACPRL
jgi:hypothetical protein